MPFVLVKVPCLQGEGETVKGFLLAGRLIGGSCDVISHSVILLPLLLLECNLTQSFVFYCHELPSLTSLFRMVGWLAGFASWINSLLLLTIC